MPKFILYPLLAMSVATIVFFTNLGSAGLWDEDETLYASCAREMFQQDDWVVPRFNGKVFPDKPPLMFWTMMGGFALFGETEFAARFGSAVLGLGSVLLTYHLGRRLFRAEAGLWAGLVLGSTIIFTVSARAATVDCAMAFCTTLAMFLFVRGGMAGRAQLRGSAWTDWLTWVGIYACLAVAVLGKGPIGLLLPAASIGLFLLVTPRPGSAPREAPPTGQSRWRGWLLAMVRPFAPKNFLAAVWEMCPLSGIVVLVLIALPWYILVDQRTNGVWVREFVENYNLRPFRQPFLGHSGPFFYYIPAILIGLFPWSVFLGPGLISLVRQLRQRHPWSLGLTLASCWTGVFVVFWSIVTTKLPHYVVPAYPALALMVGCFLDRYLTNPSEVRSGWIRSAMITLVVVGLGIGIAVPIATRVFVPGEELLGLVGLSLVIGGAACLVLVRRDQPRWAMAVFTVTSVVFVVSMFGPAAIRIAQHQNAPGMIALIRSDCPGEHQLASYRFFRQSMVYYGQQPVELCDEVSQLRKFLAASTHPYIFTLDKYEAEIRKAFPEDLYVLTRERRFAHHRDEMLVLARRPGSTVANRPAAEVPR